MKKYEVNSLKFIRSYNEAIIPCGNIKPQLGVGVCSAVTIREYTFLF